jgi:hypothetical protein
MAFARQFFMWSGPNLEDIIDPEFVRRDPCLNCSLPFDCDEGSKECRYVQITGRKPELNDSDDDQIKRDLLEILLKL